MSPEDEHALFACSFEKYKIGLMSMNRTRHMLITSKAIYNFTPDAYTSANRVIMLHDLTGVVQSASSDHILLQVLFDHDFYIRATNDACKQMIVMEICKAYAALELPEVCACIFLRRFWYFFFQIP